MENNTNEQSGEIHITSNESVAQSIPVNAEPVDHTVTPTQPETKNKNTAVQAKSSTNFTLNELLDLVIDHKASDLHMSANNKIAVRIDGDIDFIENIGNLSPEKAEEIMYQGLLKGDSGLIEQFKKTGDMDFAYTHTDGTPFRVNMFKKRGNISAVLRRINRNPYTFDQLGLPEAVNKLVEAKSGLVLVCGPTGSGKSTTLAAMIEWVNQHRSEHIITIEDPIEYIFESKKSVISQREVGHDTRSFASALRSLLREDPDVAMIGELRDPETIMTAIELCETGHLVFGTFHTGSAAQTVNRIIANFPPAQQSAVSTRLADALVGILCQRLVPQIGGGRTGIYELVIANGAIRNLVRQNETAQIDSTIQTGSSSGMISMRRYADQKRSQGLIREEDYINFFRED